MKKLLLIGNGPIGKDISDKVNQFDYVFRVNRMTNLHETGTRIDGVYIGVYKDFLDIYKGGENKEYYKTAGRIFLDMYGKFTLLNKWKDYMTEEQWHNVGIIHLFSPVPCATTTIRVLDHLLSTSAKEYEIWIAGIDVEGRGDLMAKGEPWKGTCHAETGYDEEKYLKDLIKNNKIKVLNYD